MNLTPREKDKLLVSLAAMVARGRLARGVKLNHPEAVALITDFVVEGARDGRSVADLMEAGAHVITAEQCMSGIPEMIATSPPSARLSRWRIASAAPTTLSTQIESQSSPSARWSTTTAGGPCRTIAARMASSNGPR